MGLRRPTLFRLWGKRPTDKIKQLRTNRNSETSGFQPALMVPPNILQEMGVFSKDIFPLQICLTEIYPVLLSKHVPPLSHLRHENDLS